MKSTRLLLAVAAAVLVAAPAVASTSTDLHTITTLDYAAGQHPEGIAVARDGSLLVGMAPTGQLARVTTDGTVTDLGAPAFPADAGYLLGLALDSRERVYGAIVRFDGATTGVYRFDGSAWTLFAATDQTGFPNGLAFTDDGTLLVGDSALGTIWAVDRSGSVSTWLHDERLAPGELGFGVNGLAVDRDGSVWFTNSEHATVGRIAVNRRGDAVGHPKVVAHDDLLSFADGITLDRSGNAWVAASYGSDRLLRVTPRGAVRLVADHEDGLDYTASVAFGRKPATRNTLYFTNSGDDFQQPSVMSLR